MNQKKLPWIFPGMWSTAMLQPWGSFSRVFRVSMQGKGKHHRRWGKGNNEETQIFAAKVMRKVGCAGHGQGL